MNHLQGRDSDVCRSLKLASEFKVHCEKKLSLNGCVITFHSQIYSAVMQCIMKLITITELLGYIGMKRCIYSQQSVRLLGRILFLYSFKKHHQMRSI